MKRIARSTLQTAVNLVFFALIATAVLTSTYYLTRDTIAQTVENAKLKLIMQIAPAELFDNDIMRDKLDIPASDLLGTTDTTTAYRARLLNAPSAVVLEAIAPDGYGGKISLILAVRASGELAGVRVVSHKETPGLGDYIELPKDPWIKGFDGKSRTEYKDADWKVKKDGGRFDYMAGATITPRAVVKAVNRALIYFDENRDKLFAVQNPTPPNLPLSGEEQRKPVAAVEEKK
ncbi:MAG: electron transport complex subunit RsxG [Gallionellaceae bacterium]|nr:electron transport complex subunit RsxG [Gallionellaceae bacterium]